MLHTRQRRGETDKCSELDAPSLAASRLWAPNTSSPDKRPHDLSGTGAKLRRSWRICVGGYKHELIALQPVYGWQAPACIGAKRVRPVDLLGIGTGIQSEASFEQQGAIRGMNGETIACESRYCAGRTQIIGRMGCAVHFERHLLPAPLKCFQVALGLGSHSDGWFFARFFHL